MKIYTRTGDAGDTALFGGGRVPKDADRIEAYGTVDEVNAVIGVARAHVRADDKLSGLDELLAQIQSDLFVAGSDLATPPEARTRPPRVSVEHAEVLERAIDTYEAELPPLKNFILPAGGIASASLHHARTVARRAERAVVRLSHDEQITPETIIYLNRLSDFLFVAARWCAHRRGETEAIWKGL